MNQLTHLDQSGHAHMVDITAKSETERRAVAACRVTMQPETLALIASAAAPKGDVLAAARIAGIMAAKRTADLIPLCHPIPLAQVAIGLEPAENAVEIRATVTSVGRTGVEMEALTAASVTALTIYDMCKATDRGMRIDALRVVEKSGGRSGAFTQE